MKSYTKRITSVVLSLAIAVGATSFTKFSNVNAQETPATPQEPSVLNEENADLEINDLAELEKFRDNVNSGITYEGKTVTLNADIDMSSIDNWNAIGMFQNSVVNKPFKGTFEGKNRTISNLKMDCNGCSFFDFIGEGAIIKNLGMENVNIKKGMGGLVGWNDGRIENSYAKGTVTGTSIVGVGGLVGENFRGTIENCYATVEVTGTGRGIVFGAETGIGGLVGLNRRGGNKKQLLDRKSYRIRICRRLSRME